MTNYRQPFDEMDSYEPKIMHNEEDESWKYRRNPFNRRTYHQEEITKSEKKNKQIDDFVDNILANQNLKYKTKEVSQYITKLEESLKKLLLIKPFLKDLNSMELQNEIMKLESEINNLQVLDNQNEIETFIINHTNKNIEKSMSGLKIDSQKLNTELNMPINKFEMEKNTLPIENTFPNQILPVINSILNESKEIDFYSLSKELWISLKKISQQFDQNFLAGLGLTETDNKNIQGDNKKDEKEEKKEEDEKEEKKEDEIEKEKNEKEEKEETNEKKEKAKEKEVEVEVEKEKVVEKEKAVEIEIEKKVEIEKEKEKDKKGNKVKTNQMINKFRINTKQTYQTTILNQQKKFELIENLISDLEMLKENPELVEVTRNYLMKILEFYWNIEINNENIQLLQNDEGLIVKFNPDLHQKINPNVGETFHLLIPGLEQNGKIIMKTLGYFQ